MKFLLTMAMFLCSCVFAAGNKTPIPPAATLEIVGDVNGLMSMLFLVKSNELALLPVKAIPSNVVQINIASRGGEVEAMKQILERMKLLKTYGYVFSCTATIAYSAAFMIWEECDSRLAYRLSSLLFHRPYISFARNITSKDAREMADGLEKDDVVFIKMLMEGVGKFMPEVDVIKHMDAETFWTGETLCKQAPGFCYLLN